MMIRILLLTILIAFVRGFDDITWKEEIEKRLSLVEKSNIRLLKENEDLRHENEELKQDLKELRKSVHKCETLCKTETGKELSDRTVGDSETFSEPSTIPKGFNNHDQMPSRRSQPVPRILPPETHTVSAVAFYTYLSKPSAPNLPAHHLMVYDVVQINRGNGYNKGDGIFLAPVSGIYAFHFSLCVIEGENFPWASLEVAVNGQAIGSTYEEGLNSGQPGGYHCSSNLVISDVNSGDHVFIRTQASTRGVVISNTNGRTSFSGWLLYR